MAQDKISVEAEQSGPNEATLTVKDMALRRRINDKLGRHNVALSHAKLKRIGFPIDSIRDLEAGRPVRFRMNPEGYMSLLGVAADAVALGGLDGLGDTKTYASIREGWDSGDHTFLVASNDWGRQGNAYRREYSRNGYGLYGGTAPHNGEFPPHRYDSGSRYYFDEDLAKLLGGGGLDGHDSPDSSEYKWYVVLDVDDGTRNGRQLIESGWEYKEDAQDHSRSEYDLPPDFDKGKVITRTGLRRKNLDPSRAEDWFSTTIRERGLSPRRAT